MPRYAAFLRGVSPMNCRMPELKRAFEAAGFTNVVTLLSSGNVVFDSASKATAAIEKKAEAAMQKALGRSFMTIVRPVAELAKLVEGDPWKGHGVGADAKRIVTFLRAKPKAVKLPVEQDGASILRIDGDMAFSAYLRTDKGPVFMVLIDRTFGKEQTTRTWDTVRKAAAR
jgi:uncharacterized protein (DUF1697 family)